MVGSLGDVTSSGGNVTDMAGTSRPRQTTAGRIH